MSTTVSICSRFAEERVDDMCKLYRLGEEDLARIRSFAGTVMPRLADLVSTWYAWLAEQPEYAQFFPETQTLERVQGLQHSYWKLFLQGVVDEK